MTPGKKNNLAKRRHWRVRTKVVGSKERPRMSVCFTHKHIHVQFVDDAAGATLASATTTSKVIPDKEKLTSNAAGAKLMGAYAAKTAIEKGIKAVVFDRGGARYHGKVKALADAAREAGLQF
jgi:large subunit ribosomal protein L18